MVCWPTSSASSRPMRSKSRRHCRSTVGQKSNAPRQTSNRRPFSYAPPLPRATCCARFLKRDWQWTGSRRRRPRWNRSSSPSSRKAISMPDFNFGRVTTIAVHEYLVNARRAGFIIFTLLPVAIGLIGLVIAAFFSGQASRFLENQFAPAMSGLVGVVDQSGLYTPILASFSGQFLAFADEPAAQQALAA